jgi:hypothetical protein
MQRLKEYVFAEMGQWKSLQDLEESLNLNELHRLFLTSRRKQHEAQVFAAALKGIELDPYEDPDYENEVTFEEVTARAQRKVREQLGLESGNSELEEIGFGVELI